MESLEKWERAGIIATISIVLAFPAYLLKNRYLPIDEVRTTSDSPAIFTGSAACGKCHKQAYDKWRSSHHYLAMAEASTETVLGDFSGTEFTSHGVTSRFSRKGDRYAVHTEGPDGAMADYEIAYTFGAYPLQQYLIAFPGGRLQCLDIAWDSREKKWYHLYAGERHAPGEWLHWTGAGLNWNGMCAECHSTNLTKGYNPVTGAYETTWSEINVGCEACHGPGSRHAAWGELPPMARPEVKNYLLVNDTATMTNRGQVELCARCHARRMLLGDYQDGPEEFLDKMAPELLQEGLYFPDGQILDEVYEYGSFTQSKMFVKGVRCGDCHDVHSGRRHKDGNDLCFQCHRADTYDTYEHHFHKKIHEGKPSAGALCEKCHMPGRIYMGIDYRLDHSIRIPRPDLSIALGTPNACNQVGCHNDKSNEWSNEHFTKWYGVSRRPHYATVLAAGRKADPRAFGDLAKLAADPLSPAIVRATAVSLLRAYPGEDAMASLRKAGGDEEAIVRRAALVAAEGQRPEHRLELALPLLADPIKAVRTHAAFMLSSVPEDVVKERLSEKDRQVYTDDLKEFRNIMEYAGDFATARQNLGTMYANTGKRDDAENEYGKAIAIDRDFVPAKVNLAMLANQAGKNEVAEELFREVFVRDPENAEIAYMLGLLLSEMKKYDEAADCLQKAAKGMPGDAQVHYNLGQLLQYLKKTSEAETAFLHALAIEPENQPVLEAITGLYLGNHEPAKAKEFGERLLILDPANPKARKLLQAAVQTLMRAEK